MPDLHDMPTVDRGRGGRRIWRTTRAPDETLVVLNQNGLMVAG